MIPLNDQQIFIPVLLPEHILVFHCRPDDPLPAIAIDAAGMLIGGRVDLELQSLRNIRRSRLEARMEENPAIAVAYTPEPEGKLEVFVVLRGLQVSIAIGSGIPVDNSILDDPLFGANGLPSAEVHSVEELHPLRVRKIGVCAAAPCGSGGRR